MADKPLEPELALKIIRAIYEGVTLRKSCLEHGVGAIRFYKSLEQYPDLQNAYACARQALADSYGDEIITISDTEEDAQKARNRIEARKWLASKMHPSVFGDRLDVNVSQIVDIGSALKDARLRAGLLPVRDQLNVIDVQTSRSTTLQLPSARDYKSTERSEPKDATHLKLEDLLD